MAGTTISSAAMNDDLSDIAAALTGSLPRNGEAGMLGQFRATDGSVIAPGISFINDTNTGIYRPADDQLAIAVGGVQVALFTSGGLQGQLPIGTVLDFAGSTVPSLFVLCYGQNVSRTTYAALFAIIGTTYGAGDGVTTFGLPDLRGRSIFGKDNMGGSASSRLTSTYFGADPTVLGNGGGVQSRQLITANLPAYTPSGTIAVTDGPINVSQNAITGSSTTGGGAFPCGGNSSATISATQSGTTASFNGSPQGGTATAFGTVDPALILNKIIYAGA